MTVLPLDEVAPETMTAYVMAASMRTAIEWVRMGGEPSVACHNLLTNLNEVKYSVYSDDPTVRVLTTATERALSMTDKSTEPANVLAAFAFLVDALSYTRLDAESINNPVNEDVADSDDEDDVCEICGIH